MTKKIYKFPTGATIPEGAVYLSTVTQTEMYLNVPQNEEKPSGCWEKCWLVWHYFLVEVDQETI